MWEIVFNVSDSKWIFDSLKFSVPWLVFVCLWTYFVRKASVFMGFVGLLFVIVGLVANFYSVYFFFYDKNQLESGRYVEVAEGIATEIIDDPKRLKFEVEGKIFKGSNYRQWIVPTTETIEKIKGYKRVRVFYVPKAEHGVSPPGNKVLRIDVYII